MSEKPSVFILYNLRTGKASLQERDILYGIAHDKITGAGYDVCFKDGLELDRNFYDTLDKSLEVRPDYLVIVGGDGTVQTTLTELIRLYKAHLPEHPFPKVLVLPSGTMNNLSTSLGMFRLVLPNLYSLIPGWRNRTKTVQLFERFASSLKEERFETMDVPVLEVIADGDRDNALYGFIFATGPLARFIDDYHRRKGDYRGRSTEGTLRAIWSGLYTIVDRYVSAKLFGENSPKYQRIRGHTSVGEWQFESPLAIALSTIPKLGLMGFSPFYHVIRHDGETPEARAHAVVFNIHPRELNVIPLLRGLVGRLRNHPHFKMLPVDEVRFDLEQDLPFLLDAQVEYPCKNGTVVDIAPMSASRELIVNASSTTLSFIHGFK